MKVCIMYLYKNLNSFIYQTSISNIPNLEPTIKSRGLSYCKILLCHIKGEYFPKALLGDSITKVLEESPYLSVIPKGE